MPATPRRLMTTGLRTGLRTGLTTGRAAAGVVLLLLVVAAVSPLTGRAEPAGTFRDYTRPVGPSAACLPLADAFQLSIAPLFTRDAFVRESGGDVRRVVRYQLFTDPAAAFASARDHLASHGYAVLEPGSEPGRGDLEAAFRAPDGTRVVLRVSPLAGSSAEVPVTAYARVNLAPSTFVPGAGCRAPARYHELVRPGS